MHITIIVYRQKDVKSGFAAPRLLKMLQNRGFLGSLDPWFVPLTPTTTRANLVQCSRWHLLPPNLLFAYLYCLFGCYQLTHELPEAKGISRLSSGIQI